MVLPPEDLKGNLGLEDNHSHDLDSPGSSLRSQNRIFGGVERIHWPLSPTKSQKDFNEMTPLSITDQGHTAGGGRGSHQFFLCYMGSLIALNQATFSSTTDMLVTMSYKNNLTLPLGDNDFPSLHDKHSPSNLGVAERQSGCQAGHLAD